MKLGQHFLTNKNKLKRIVEVMDLNAGDTIIEIGPGHGEITDELRIKNNEVRIIAIEKDKELVQFLNKKFEANKNIKIIHGDILKNLSSLIHNSLFIIQNYKLAGNIPYYITGYLFRILGELKNKPSLIVLTIQKEVAQRIIAKPPKMNLLAASVQFWAEPKIIDYISKKDFKPEPKVDSAIIKLRIKNYELRIMNNYYRFINVLFKQPRKTILNNIKYQISKVKNKEDIVERLQKIGVNPSDRPQNLRVEQIIKLSTLF